MAPSALRDLEGPNNSDASATSPVAGDGLLAEVLPFRRPDLPTPGSDFQSLVCRVAELARFLTGASGSAIAYREEQGTICRARSGEGVPPLGAPVDTTSGISKQCLESGTALCVEDIATDRRVAPEISQVAGIRAVAVVPIYSDGAISGILEVVSITPGIFTDQHLKRLQQLASLVGAAAHMPSEVVDVPLNGYPDIVLLVELEPAYRAFFRNLADLVSRRSPARRAGSSSQMDGWNDVLVDFPIPWKRFFESVLLHIIVVGMFSGIARIWPPEVLVSPRPLREARVTYYPFSQSFRARESSRPAVHPRRQHTSARQEVIHAGRDSEPRVASDIGSKAGQQVQALTAPAMPMLAMSPLRKLGLGAATSVLPPPPDIDGAEARHSHLPNFSVVAPPPDLGGASGLRRINAPRTAVVPPSPDIRGSITRAGLIEAVQPWGGSAGTPGISIVPPPPSVDGRGNTVRGGLANSLANGSSQIVPPPPSVDGRGNSVRGGLANSLANGGSQIVPPPPSVDGRGNTVRGGLGSSLANGSSQVVPPPPSLEGGGNSGVGGRGGALARAGGEVGLSPASAPGAGNSGPGGTGGAKDVPMPSVAEVGGNRGQPFLEDVQLRLVGLAWAPPRSSYYSNFEVFIAEKGPNKKEESQLVKLVYEFLPYQPRLSEYGFDSAKVRKLRVTRDPTCDESLMQISWPEGENGSAGSHHSGDVLAPTSTDRNNLLPCYRTTADDYRRAVSKSR